MSGSSLDVVSPEPRPVGGHQAGASDGPSGQPSEGFCDELPNTALVLAASVICTLVFLAHTLIG